VLLLLALDENQREIGNVRIEAKVTGRILEVGVR
jgi:hypothetical protein